MASKPPLSGKSVQVNVFALLLIIATLKIYPTQINIQAMFCFLIPLDAGYGTKQPSFGNATSRSMSRNSKKQRPDPLMRNTASILQNYLKAHTIKHSY